MTTEQQSPTVHVKLAERSYDIHIASELSQAAPHHVAEWISQFPHWQTSRPALFLVTDSNVGTLFAEAYRTAFVEAGWQVHIATVPAGEASKSNEQVQNLYDQLVEFQADRRTVVLALGGGVIGDLAGFVAASFMRGLPFVQVPTSLLADVDSSVGGKVGINHSEGKNLIGAFHQPLGVLIDTACLKTLPDRDYRSGLAEVVKYGVILDAEFFEYLEAHIEEINRRDESVLREIITKSCQLKADVVEEDEFERTGLRAILNYGHTFAHAYEALCGYGELMHGEAVSIGMIDASRLAEKLNRIDADVTARQQELLSALHLPTALPATTKLEPAEIVERMRLDKKTVGAKLRFILPTRIGHVETVQDVPEQTVLDVLGAD